MNRPDPLDATGDEPVCCHHDGPIGYLTLNRPGALNAVTIGLANALEAGLQTLAEDSAVLVIRGAGGNFSVGGDFGELERLRALGTDATSELFEAFAAARDLIGRLPVPVVAGIEGYAMAGGLELALACDVVVVRDDAVLCDNHANFGMVPGGGSSQLLPRAIGPQRALALLLTGDRIDGATAAAWGIAYRSVPAERFEAELGALATQLAAKDRRAAARTKALAREGLGLPLEVGLARERAMVLTHLAEPDANRGVDRFNRRKG